MLTGLQSSKCHFTNIANFYLVEDARQKIVEFCWMRGFSNYIRLIPCWQDNIFFSKITSRYDCHFYDIWTWPQQCIFLYVQLSRNGCRSGVAKQYLEVNILWLLYYWVVVSGFHKHPTPFFAVNTKVFETYVYLYKLSYFLKQLEFLVFIEAYVPQFSFILGHPWIAI